MQNFRNYFELLGVTQDASAEEIKRSYRQLARQYHPDLNPGNKDAEERFKLLGEAYEVLSDPEKRAQYEEYSSFWKQQGFRQRVSQFSFKSIDFSELGDFNTFVEQLLNRRNPTTSSSDPQVKEPSSRRNSDKPPSSRSRPSRSNSSSRRDAEASLTIPLERAYAGGQERIRLEDGRSLEVDMPPGMVTGQRIRLKGQGIGGGNLYLRIEVEPHPFFQIVDNDVFCRIPITPAEAALGGEITVPTLDGSVQLTIPAGVPSGKRLRLAERGYPIGRERRGDQIVEVEVVIPTQLSDRERTLYKELKAIETFAPRESLLTANRQLY
ncbi:MAG: J domain-containing protein [Cyanobacteria bacterium J06638_28]